MINETGTFTDPSDGRVYRTVKIGRQIWMAENLDAEKYRNGDLIANRKGKNEWGKSEAGAWCFYDNKAKNEETYGKLYNWFAVSDLRGLAPDGWHIPTDDEWKELEIYLGLGKADAGYRGWRGSDIGGKLKETGTMHWCGPNTGATNESGFTARPGGYRDIDGFFYVLGYGGYWWSASEHTEYIVWYRSLYHTYSKIHRTDSYAGDGFSVRCIRNY
ncbi:MAG: fibrobacter succinogenes major paralogous domain-containing protein [Bacteroidales bacterium]|nr:fibrobacter succinogenes major paralogous domain-containing protein [Bacteroidales bacterium]